MKQIGKHRQVLSSAATFVRRLIGTSCAPTAGARSSPPGRSDDWPRDATLRAFPMLLG